MLTEKYSEKARTLRTSSSVGCVYPASRLPVAERGVVLLISLMILVALSLAAIALVRSVDTTNVIAGNLAFQKSATISGDAGTEAALKTLVDLKTAQKLDQDDASKAYTATAVDAVYTSLAGGPINARAWEDYWWASIQKNKNLTNNAVTAKVCGAGGGPVCTLPTDLAGNTVSYTIQRLCTRAEPPENASNECVRVNLPGGDPRGNFDSPSPEMQPLKQQAYRITTRIVGPRNTISFIQAILAI